MVGKAAKKLRDANAVEGLSMMFYMSYPESSFESLNFLADTFKKIVKN